MKTIVAAISAILMLAGCGSASSTPKEPPLPAKNAASLTPAQLAEAFIAYDSVRTRPLPPRLGCERLAVYDTRTRVFAGAWAVVSRSEACAASMQMQRAQHLAVPIGANVWVEWTSAAGSQTRSLVMTFTTAAFVVSRTPRPA